ncbi:bll3470 hypothetical protein [Bradyrhizobium sp.]|nr:bll3470 hypothetical protein [Bradyrhizobium sp.]
MNLRHASTATYLAAALSILAGLLAPVRADDNVRIQEEVWALPLPLPMLAYVVRPVGGGPFPLAIMNHGVSLKPVDRSFFPLVEFRDAAKWFAKRGYLVVAPVGTGFGAAAIDIPEHGVYGRSSPRSVTAPIRTSTTPAVPLRKPISGPPCRSACTTPSPLPAARPNII